LVGHRRAAEAFNFGEPFNADAARELGIVNAVVAGNELLPQRRQRHDNCGKPPSALRHDKSFAQTGSAAIIADAMAKETEAICRSFARPGSQGSHDGLHAAAQS